MQYIGIDPGKTGGIVAITDDSICSIKLSHTEHDVAYHLQQLIEADNSVATIELVHAMPKQGVSSSFTFGRSYGFLIGLLTANKIPYEFVSPQKWQKVMKCLSKGDKNVTKAAAQRLWPYVTITHANADALLIAEYGRKHIWNGSKDSLES
jgi:crossover junction endodeoxyribonuclease RuvC